MTILLKIKFSQTPPPKKKKIQWHNIFYITLYYMFFTVVYIIKVVLKHTLIYCFKLFVSITVLTFK